MIYLRFSYDNTDLFSLLTRFVMQEKWSHCEALSSDNRLCGAIPFKGVDYREIPRNDVSLLVAINADNWQHATFWNVLRDEMGKPYDYIGAYGLAWQRDWEDDSRWYCSELLAWALKQAHLLDLSDYNRVSPDVLLKYLQKLKE